MFNKDRTEEKNRLVSETTNQMNSNPSSYIKPKKTLDWVEDYPKSGWWAVRKLKKASLLAGRESRISGRYSACIHSLVSGLENNENSDILKFQKKYLSAIQRGRLGSAQKIVSKLIKLSEVDDLIGKMDVTVQPSTLNVGSNECLILITSRTEKSIIITRVDVSSKGAVVDVSPHMSKPIPPKSQVNFLFTISPVMPGSLTVMALIRYSDTIRETTHKVSFSMNVLEKKETK